MENNYYIDHEKNLNDYSHNDYKENINGYSPFVGIFFLIFISFCFNCLPSRIDNISDLENRERLIINDLPVLRIEEVINDTCSICLERFKLDDMINKLNCNHIYHKGCLDSWIQNNNCPLCRSIIV